MFTLPSILKRSLGRIIISAVAVAALTLVAQPAQAAGETYTWTDTSNQAVAVVGGSGNVSGSLAKTGDTTAAVFAGNVTFACNGVTKTTQLTLSVPNDRYKQIYPTPSSITVGADAACGNFDPRYNVTQANGQTTADQAAAEADKPCDSGSLTWLMCPVITNATGAISKLADGVLVPLLRVKQINPTTTPELYHVWERMRDLAEVLFLLVFLVIIFSTLLQQDIGKFDQYTIKKILPRLVAAAILVQASFLFVGFMVDIGNVMGAGIETLMRAVGGPNPQADFAHVFSNLVVGGLAALGALGLILGTAEWIIIAPLLVSLAITLLVVFLVLGLRFLLIAILIAVSPLAMVAWVLPNTRHWAHDWMELLFRLILMYPIVVGVISLAGLINDILPSGTSVTDSAGASIAALLIKPIVVLAAFLIIPLTFRLAGKGLNRAYDVMNGHANRGKGALKSSSFWERGEDAKRKRQNKQVERFMGTSAITKLNSGNKGQRALAGAAVAGFGGGLLMGGPTSKRDLDKRNAQAIRKEAKNLDDLTEAENPGNLKAVLRAYSMSDVNERKAAIAKLEQTTPNLAEIGRHQAGRMAIFRNLSAKGLASEDDINNVLNAGLLSSPISVSKDIAGEYPAVLSAVGGSRSTHPFSTIRLANATDTYTPKDVAGNPVLTTDANGNQVPLMMHRDRGDLDGNAINEQLRKQTARSLGDKFSLENWNVLIKGASPTATPLERRVAMEAAQHIATSLPERAISGAFDAQGKLTAPVENRLKIARGFQAQRTILQQTPVGRAKYETLAADFHRDTDLTDPIARISGMPIPMVDSMTPPAKALIAYEWYNGHVYDPAIDGSRDYAAEGHQFVMDREQQRQKNNPNNNQGGGGSNPGGGNPNPGRGPRGSNPAPRPAPVAPAPAPAPAPGPGPSPTPSPAPTPYYPSAPSSYSTSTPSSPAPGPYYPASGPSYPSPAATTIVPSTPVPGPSNPVPTRPGATYGPPIPGPSPVNSTPNPSTPRPTYPPRTP